MARQAPGSAVLDALRDAVRVRRVADLRRGRRVRARVPGRDRHRASSSSSFAPADTRARRAGRDRGGAALRRRRAAAREPASASGVRASGCSAARGRGAAAVAAPRGAGPCRRSDSDLAGSACRRRLRRRCRRTRRARAPPPSTCRRASTGSSATRAGAARHPTVARGARRRVGARGPAALDPARRRRRLLRRAVELEGLRGRPRRCMAERARGGARALERRRPAAGRDRRQLLHPRAAAASCDSTGVEMLDSIEWVARSRARAAAGQARSWPRSPCIPTCAVGPSGAHEQARGGRRGARR